MPLTPMKFIGSRTLPATAVLLLLCVATTGHAFAASLLDTNGVTLLRLTTTNLDGSGVRIAQPEASADTNLLDFQVNPADGSVDLPASRFAYASSAGSATNYPNAVGVYSSHAQWVAAHFYGRPFGVAKNVSHVDCYDADYFVNTFIFTNNPPDPNARIVNQSFIFGPLSVPDQQMADSAYDDAAAQHDTLYVCGAGNGGPVFAPATCYNGLGVAAFGGSSSVGPTPDNGRCKPDITAPADFTSFSTPQVAGAAAVLLQAGLRGDGGGDTNSAAKIQTLKALLLNGAVKPANWTNSITAPLDARYGAGVLNLFNSYRQLAGGKHTNIASVTVPTNDPHPPTGAPGSIAALSGWDFTSLSSSTPNDRINHYYLVVTNGASNARFTVAATLVWNRQQGETNLNNLNLFLYDTATSNLIAQSISGVDNTEHIHTSVPPGRYDLQVWKAGGHVNDGNISNTESYALAWEFFAVPLSITPGGTNAVLTWPIYPDGFALQATPVLNPPSWSTLNLPRTITNGTNRIEVPLNSSNQFFRLRRPN